MNQTPFLYHCILDSSTIYSLTKTSAQEQEYINSIIDILGVKNSTNLYSEMLLTLGQIKFITQNYGMVCVLKITALSTYPTYLPSFQEYIKGNRKSSIFEVEDTFELEPYDIQNNPEQINFSPIRDSI